MPHTRNGRLVTDLQQTNNKYTGTLHLAFTEDNRVWKTKLRMTWDLTGSLFTGEQTHWDLDLTTQD